MLKSATQAREHSKRTTPLKKSAREVTARLVFDQARALRGIGLRCDGFWVYVATCQHLRSPNYLPLRSTQVGNEKCTLVYIFSPQLGVGVHGPPQVREPCL